MTHAVFALEPGAFRCQACGMLADLRRAIAHVIKMQIDLRWKVLEL